MLRFYFSDAEAGDAVMEMKQMGMQQQHMPPLAGRRETKDEGSGGAHLVAGLGVVRPLVVLALCTLVLLLTLPSVAHRRHSLDLLLFHRPAASQGGYFLSPPHSYYR